MQVYCPTAGVQFLEDSWLVAIWINDAVNLCAREMSITVTHRRCGVCVCIRLCGRRYRMMPGYLADVVANQVHLRVKLAIFAYWLLYSMLVRLASKFNYLLLAY